MKLYTEEQVKEIYFKGVHNGRLHIEGKCSDEVESLTPIELPTDEEIREVIKPFQNQMDDFDLGFRNGVQWLREKIQGGEQ